MRQRGRISRASPAPSAGGTALAAICPQSRFRTRLSCTRTTAFVSRPPARLILSRGAGLKPVLSRAGCGAIDGSSGVGRRLHDYKFLVTSEQSAPKNGDMATLASMWHKPLSGRLQSAVGKKPGDRTRHLRQVAEHSAGVSRSHFENAVPTDEFLVTVRIRVHPDATAPTLTERNVHE